MSIETCHSFNTQIWGGLLLALDHKFRRISRGTIQDRRSASTLRLRLVFDWFLRLVLLERLLGDIFCELVDG